MMKITVQKFHNACWPGQITWESEEIIEETLSKVKNDQTSQEFVVVYSWTSPEAARTVRMTIKVKLDFATRKWNLKFIHEDLWDGRPKEVTTRGLHQMTRRTEDDEKVESNLNKLFEEWWP